MVHSHRLVSQPSLVALNISQSLFHPSLTPDTMKAVVPVATTLLLCAIVLAGNHSRDNKRQIGYNGGRAGGQHDGHRNGWNGHCKGHGHHNMRCEEVQCKEGTTCVEHIRPRKCHHHPTNSTMRRHRRVRITSKCVRNPECKPPCLTDEICHVMHHTNTAISQCRPKKGHSHGNEAGPTVHPAGRPRRKPIMGGYRYKRYFKESNDEMAISSQAA